jgi:NADH:ubiquinone oxidoreductase subunit E
LPCALRGAEKLTSFLRQTLGIEVGQTTGDGRFTLSEVECLASCGTAPMMQVNDDYYENLTDDKVTEILASLK